MIYSKRSATMLATLVLGIAMGGCTTMRAVEPADDASLGETIQQDAPVMAGDFVEITRADGREIEGMVESVDGASIVLTVGESTETVMVDEIAALNIREVSPLRSIALGWSLLYAVGIISVLNAFGAI